MVLPDVHLVLEVFGLLWLEGLLLEGRRPCLLEGRRVGERPAVAENVDFTYQNGLLGAFRDE